MHIASQQPIGTHGGGYSIRRRTAIPSAGLALAGLLLLGGCSASTSTADACADVTATVTKVSDAAQSALNKAQTPSELQADLTKYVKRVDSLAEKTQNAEVSEALGTLSDKLGDASDFVATVPTDANGEVDPDALADQRTAIQDSVDTVNALCTASPSPTSS